MTKFSNDFSHLWNDLPKDERMRLMPHMVETQKLHILQCKLKAIRAHKAHMRELNSLLGNLEKELEKYRASHGE